MKVRTDMGIMRKMAGVGVLMFVSLVPLSAAHAGCEPYCGGPNTPTTVGGGDSGAVLPSESEQTPPTTAAVEATVSETPAAPAVVETPAAVESAPTGSLPFTGSDVVGITVIGVAALGIGTLMVPRAKVAQAVA